MKVIVVVKVIEIVLRIKHIIVIKIVFSPHTLVGYESPFRIAATLKAAAECLGERRAVVCFELTKIHEHVERGTLEELSARMSDRKIKGEITFVIEGKRRAKGKSNEENDED